jgi:hypothetical protein
VPIEDVEAVENHCGRDDVVGGKVEGDATTERCYWYAEVQVVLEIGKRLWGFGHGCQLNVKIRRVEVRKAQPKGGRIRSDRRIKAESRGI